MKRISFTLIFLFILCANAFSSVFVVDETHMVPFERRMELDGKLRDLSAECGVGIYVHMANAVIESPVVDAENAFYDFGHDKEYGGIGVLFFIATEGQRYAIVSFGDALTDEGLSSVSSAVVEGLKNSSYGDAIEAFADSVSSSLGSGGASSSDLEAWLTLAIIICGPSLAISLFISWLYERQLVTVKEAKDANRYANFSEMKMMEKDEKFLYMSEHRIQVESDDDSDRRP